MALENWSVVVAQVSHCFFFRGTTSICLGLGVVIWSVLSPEPFLAICGLCGCLGLPPPLGGPLKLQVRPQYLRSDPTEKLWKVPGIFIRSTSAEVPSEPRRYVRQLIGQIWSLPCRVAMTTGSTKQGEAGKLCWTAGTGHSRYGIKTNLFIWFRKKRKRRN